MKKNLAQAHRIKTVLYLFLAFLLLTMNISSWLYAAASDNGRRQTEQAGETGQSLDGVQVQAAPCTVYPHNSYLPYVTNPSTNAPALPPPLPPPTPLSGTPPVDFASVRADLQTQGLDLAFNKIGFHVAVGGNNTGLTDNWWKKLDAAGVPVFLKSADSGGQLFEVQEWIKSSGSVVPHTLVFRRSVPYAGADPIANPDVPDYNLDPVTAAQQHWTWHKAGFPPELDPDYVWFETINEIAKQFEFNSLDEINVPLFDGMRAVTQQCVNGQLRVVVDNAEWLGQFALETARLTMAEGYKWAAFGWSAGEPEPRHWEAPSMLAFLQLAADNPDKLAIALHEYSFDTNNIGNGYPYLIGRFQSLFDICDRNGIPRPTVMITEWGWNFDSVPDVANAMTDIQWAARLYAAYPEVKGAAIWYLGPGFGNIANQAQQLIAPVGDYSESNYFAITPGQGAIDTTLFQP